jgi:sucrose-6-phosphate hydrolase SacC (GH32 family)
MAQDKIPESYPGSAVSVHYGLFSTPGGPDDDADYRVLQKLLAGSIHRFPPLISSIPIRESPGDWIAPSLNFTVLHDGKKFRMWYDLRDTRSWKPETESEALVAVTAYAESDDGINWQRPNLGLHNYYPGVENVVYYRGGKDYCMCAAVVDDGWDGDDASGRFKIAVDSTTNGTKFGTYIAFSSDGIHWEDYERNPIFEQPLVGDILDAYYDRERDLYILTYKKWEHVDGKKTHPAGRRQVGIATSKDWISWDVKGIVISPEEGDDHFYGMSITKIDGIYVGFLRIYQSQIGPHDGIGWTEVATSADLIHWKRYKKPFLPRGPLGAFDHAMVWISAPIEWNDKFYYYYGGYPLGHAHASDRGIGLLLLER